MIIEMNLNLTIKTKIVKYEIKLNIYFYSM